MRKSGAARGPLGSVREFRERVFARMEKREPSALWLREGLSGVKKAVLILSAPRSGSSLLFSLLRHFPGVCAPSGESVPFYKLNGFSSDSFPSDAVPDDLENRERAEAGLARDILSDCTAAGGGNPCDDPSWRESFADRLALRLPMQWPGLPLRFGALRKAALGALAAHLKVSKGFRKEEFHLEFLSRIRVEHPEVDPYYYDIPAPLVAERFPRLKMPSGPPNGGSIVEEPPFILLEPGRVVADDDLGGGTLLLKSTVDCYRLDLFRSLLPNAEIRVLHLIRNPLASINGLCDGWLHRGFFSRNLRAFALSEGSGFPGLSIRGYSDRGAWGRWWWNFDLPPGWRRFAGGKLEEVCAFQWTSGNKTIQRALELSNLPSLRVRFEDLTGSLETRSCVMKEIIRFLGLDPDFAGDSLLGPLPVVQATEPPIPLRWKKRKKVLLPLLDDPDTGRVAESLGYV